MSRAFVSPRRSRLMTGFILVCFAALFYRLFDLHVLESGRLNDIAVHNRETFDTLYARRGDVVDQHGNILATTRTVYELGVDPRAVKPADLEKLPALAALIDVPLANLQTAFTTKMKQVDADEGMKEELVKWTPLHPGLEESVYKQVEDLKISGVYGNRKFERVYPDGQLAAHVLGYMTPDPHQIGNKTIPASGIERAMDFYLNGQDGYRESEHDGHGQELAQFGTQEVAPADGLNVELTIDMRLQDYAEKEVDKLVAQYQPEGVTIIMSNPVTGELLALANYPTYDPNQYTKVPEVNLKNRAVADVFEPGSTFKIVTAAAGLNEGVVQPDTKFDCSQTTIDYQGRTLKLPDDAEKLGILTVSQIVSESSNRGAAHIGVLLGEQRLHDYAYLFGFGQTTGVGLAGESRGVLWPADQWDGLMITRVPMGHAVSATALQVHQAMSVIANHGILMEPRLVRRIYDSNGNTVVAFSPKPERRVVSSATTDLLNTMLCNVVGPDGTANLAKLQNITVAGKTGTAQKIVNGHYVNDQHVSTFTGYLPAERPQLVITVIVDDAHMRGTAFGGLVSAPAFHDVAAQAVQYLGIQSPNGDSRNNFVAMKGDNLDWFR
jgi:cell division protein FtsI/penicillin-binding protein 2